MELINKINKILTKFSQLTKSFFQSKNLFNKRKPVKLIFFSKAKNILLFMILNVLSKMKLNKNLTHVVF